MMKYAALRRWFVVLAVTTLVMTVGNPALADCPCVTQASGFAGGDGSVDNPYQVCNPAHLNNVRNHMSSNFVQTENIDMGAFGNFTPIGSFVTKFSGNYNGASFEIQNISIIQSSSEDVGLFGALSTSGVLQKIVLKNSVIEGADFIGALLGQNFGLVSECQVDGSVSGTGSKVGGLVGLNVGNLTLSRSTGSVIGLFRIGGLVGELASGGSISNSYSNSSVSVLPGGDVLGGLVGIVRTSTTIENTYSTGFVQSVGSNFGGLIGLTQGGTLTASFWDTETSGQSASSGGVGKSTSEMMTQTTFDPPWDFTTIWMIDKGNDYPRLRTPVLICSFDCQCDDGNDCNGLETCNAGSCVNGTPIDCTSFDDVCAIGTCNPNNGLCEQDVATLSGSTCRSAVNECDVLETCDGINPTCPADECAAAGLACVSFAGPGKCDGNCECLHGDSFPAVSEWGVVIMLLLTLTAGTIVINDQQRSQAT